MSRAEAENSSHGKKPEFLRRRRKVCEMKLAMIKGFTFAYVSFVKNRNQLHLLTIFLRFEINDFQQKNVWTSESGVKNEHKEFMQENYAGKRVARSFLVVFGKKLFSFANVNMTWVHIICWQLKTLYTVLISFTSM